MEENKYVRHDGHRNGVTRLNDVRVGTKWASAGKVFYSGEPLKLKKSCQIWFGRGT